MSDAKTAPNRAKDFSDLSYWKGKKIFVTGHTGFKGSWLSVLLSSLGAEVHGYSLRPPTTPSLFVEAGVENVIASSTIADLRDREAMSRAMATCQPEVAFHLAAQPMVLSSYEDPFETYDVNVTGTVSFLDAARKVPSLSGIVVITTDKCYENVERDEPYREDDTLGGHDPYSNSKACCELVVQSFRKSFFQTGEKSAKVVGLASARAGNIIGGGDWGVYRLLPDFFRAYQKNEPLQIRNPDSVRPWQHVLEPLMGYLMLGQAVSREPLAFSSGWNFGPQESLVKKVGEVISALQSEAKGTIEVVYDENPNKRHEAKMLRLDCTKAKTELGWRPRLNFEQSIRNTVRWYERWMEAEPAIEVMREQINEYLSLEK